MDAARELTLAQVGMPLDGDPSGGNRYCELPLYLDITLSNGYLALRQSDRAVASFTRVIDALPADYRRDRGQYLVKLSEASAMAGLPEQAWAHASEAVTIARETGSSRTLDDVARVAASALAPWKDLPEGRAVREMLVP
jgi:tetratricopeptide (TPR) repeat protein